jgi:hypothetical protein
MKSVPKIKRVTLKISENTEPLLFGIVAAEPDYKISLALNRKLGISLKSADPVILKEENDEELLFSRFSSSPDSPDLVYDLTSNRSGKNYLIRKMRNIDYFLQVHNFDNDADTGSILSKIRETDCITAAFKIGKEIIKDNNIRFLLR